MPPTDKRRSRKDPPGIMAVSQTTAPLAQKQPLEAGDIAPGFKLAAASGAPLHPASDLVAGRPLLLLFRASDTLPQGLEGLLRQVKATDGRAVLVTAMGETAVLDGFESAADPDGLARGLFGFSGETRLALIAP